MILYFIPTVLDNSHGVRVVSAFALHKILQTDAVMTHVL